MKIIIATVAFSLASLVVSAQKKIVAKVYPKAIVMNTSDQELILTRNSGYSTANADMYLVKDEKAKIVAYYHRRAKRIMPCENGDQYLEMQTQQTLDHTWQSAGVVVSCNPYKKTAQEDIDGFTELRELVKLNFHTQAEFDAVYERYKHLNKAFFNITAQEDKVYGGYLNLQEQLYKEYSAKAKPGEADKNQMQALVMEIEKLTDEGQYVKAHTLIGKLKDQMQPTTTQQADTWAVWMEYLDILEKNAYQSLVIIHKPFALWHLEKDLTVLQTN